MKPNFVNLDCSIIDALAKCRLRLDELLEVAPLRNEALRLNIKRAGVSRSESADTTVNERLQALRREGKIAYDRATTRWELLKESANRPIRKDSHVLANVRLDQE